MSFTGAGVSWALVAPISTIAPGSTAIYSTNRVNPSYSGAIVNVERASDGTVSDFYVDNRGNFTQISGTSLTSWLGGAQANVLIWYDQSGAGRNAIKDNTTIYGRAPQLVVDPAGSGKYVIYFPNQNPTATNYYGFRISAQTTASMICRFYVKSGKTNDANWESLLCTNSDNQGVRFASLAMNTGDGNDFLNPGGFAIYDGTLKNTSPYLTATRDSWHTMMASRASGSMNMEYIGQCNATWNSGVIIARSLYGYMTDMVTFPAASTPSTYSAYFATPNISMTGAPLFNQLSLSAKSSAVGAFSLRAINGVTAKAVQIKRSSDSVTQDFWSDAQGNLLTAPITGQLIQNWLGGASGNIVTWYDQSGLGNHASQATAANQPTVTIAPTGPGYVPVFTSPTSNKFLSIPSSLNLGSVNGSYSKSLWTYVTSNVSQFQNFLATSVAPGTGTGFHTIGWNFPSASSVPYFSASQNTYAVNLVSTTFPLNTWTHLAVTYNNPTQTFIMYRNGVQVYSNTAFTSSFNAGDGALPTNFRIGVGFGNPCNSQNYDVNIFNSALSASDITTLYNSRLY